MQVPEHLLSSHSNSLSLYLSLSLLLSEITDDEPDTRSPCGFPMPFSASPAVSLSLFLSLPVSSLYDCNWICLRWRHITQALCRHQNLAVCQCQWLVGQLSRPQSPQPATFTGNLLTHTCMRMRVCVWQVCRLWQRWTVENFIDKCHVNVQRFLLGPVDSWAAATGESLTGGGEWGSCKAAGKVNWALRASAH